MNRRPGIVATAVAVPYMLALWIWAYARVPVGARMPLNADLAGHPVRHGGRGDLLLLLLVLPGVTVAASALFALLPAIEPRRRNLVRSARAYTAAWILFVGLMAAIQTLMLTVGAHPQAFGYLPEAIGILVGLLLLVTGNYLGKTRSNFLFGIKTPWTLSSDLAWTRTHRLAGRLFILLGVLVAASGWWGIVPLVAVAVAGSLALVAGLLIYSYRTWKADPAKQPVGR